jgi:hypothetical protein
MRTKRGESDPGLRGTVSFLQRIEAAFREPLRASSRRRSGACVRAQRSTVEALDGGETSVPNPALLCLPRNIARFDFHAT